MNPAEIDELVRRLVANPHDREALEYAHHAGASDPRGYATMLENVGNATLDPGFASHWLSEAANVWATTLGDAHRAARLFMGAIDRDPMSQVAADRLAQLYREKGDTKALVALLDRRAKLLGPVALQNPELRAELAGMHEELGKLWSDPPLSQPKKALEHFRRALELDPASAYAVFCARELAKSLAQWDEAWLYYEMEFALEADPARRVLLLRDEATTRRSMGDLVGATRALARARGMDEGDEELRHEYAAAIHDRVQAGENVSTREKSEATDLLVGLAESFDGEHGLAYSAAALDLDAGNDRALQLYVFYAEAIGQEDELPARYLAYLEANPRGPLAGPARVVVADSYENAGQYADAIQVLEPLRAAGDPDAAERLRHLYTKAEGEGPRVMSAEPRSERPRREAKPLTGDMLQGVLDAAQMLSGKGKKAEAFTKYREVLEVDGAHPEALAWVEDYLRTKRDYAQLRDVLFASVRAMSNQGGSAEARKERLREAAGICEGSLRDVDGAVSAWKQLLAIDRSDESARQALSRLLERTQRWDDLANVLEQEAMTAVGAEQKIAVEKRLAALHEQKRRDFGGAAEAWTRIAQLDPDDDRAIVTAAKYFEKAGLLTEAADAITNFLGLVDDAPRKGPLLEQLGDLRSDLGEYVAAGDAFAEAAELAHSPKLWENAERAYVAGEAWDRAARSADQWATLVHEPKSQAELYARAADLFGKAGDGDGVVRTLERAADLDPTNDDYASLLVERYGNAEKFAELAKFLARRGDRLSDKGKRVSARRAAATLQAVRLNDKEAARELWLKVLEDGDDREALDKLVDDAVEREDHTEATTLLRRLGNVAIDRAEKARVAIREAELIAEGMGDVEGAIQRYESILADIDGTCRPALQAIADLEEARENPSRAADALERELKLVADSGERAQIGTRLGRLYEQLGNYPAAIRALDVVRKADPEDFDALSRLAELCEATEQWDRVAELLAQRIEVEADEDDAAVMTKRLAYVLAERLDRGHEALAALTELADAGNADLRKAYVELGDGLGWKGIVAQKLVEWWFEAKHGPDRVEALRAAFVRYAEVERDQDAVQVGVEILRAKGGADKAVATDLERLAVKTKSHDALTLAHEILLRDLTGEIRAEELVRQAESRVGAGMSRVDALQHGEAGLTSVAAQDAEPLLGRLAALAERHADVVDLYERQVSRAKAPADRIRALARVAEVAASRGQTSKANQFFELALAGSPTEETLELVEEAARAGDAAAGGEKLRRALALAMAQGGQGARDGGRTRSMLLRRASAFVHGELKDLDQAFGWLTDALVANVDALTLDALEDLGRRVDELARTEAALTRALGEVFDGPLVRQLLARRARIRKDELGDRAGAAADLKKLHDLTPTDVAVLDELSTLLRELGDFRGMIQLFEDQILRGKDVNVRADLARKVARMWENELDDPREAADAWRRVLRMKAGDEEATASLERAKSAMNRKDDGEAKATAVGKPIPSTLPKAAETKGPTEPPPRKASLPPTLTKTSFAPPPLPKSAPPDTVVRPPSSVEIEIDEVDDSAPRLPVVPPTTGSWRLDVPGKSLPTTGSDDEDFDRAIDFALDNLDSGEVPSLEQTQSSGPVEAVESGEDEFEKTKPPQSATSVSAAVPTVASPFTRDDATAPRIPVAVPGSVPPPSSPTATGIMSDPRENVPNPFGDDPDDRAPKTHRAPDGYGTPSEGTLSTGAVATTRGRGHDPGFDGTGEYDDAVSTSADAYDDEVATDYDASRPEGYDAARPKGYDDEVRTDTDVAQRLSRAEFTGTDLVATGDGPATRVAPGRTGEAPKSQTPVRGVRIPARGAITPAIGSVREARRRGRAGVRVRRSRSRERRGALTRRGRDHRTRRGRRRRRVRRHPRRPDGRPEALRPGFSGGRRERPRRPRRPRDRPRTRRSDPRGRTGRPRGRGRRNPPCDRGGRPPPSRRPVPDRTS
ncbi:MAG: hypothetical protein U0169_26535 [Polyangiaceae bacterium]